MILFTEYHEAWNTKITAYLFPTTESKMAYFQKQFFFTFSYLENEIQHQIKRIENSKRTLCFIICFTKCHTKVVMLLSKYMIYTYSPAYAHFGFRKVGVSGTVSTYEYIR